MNLKIAAVILIASAPALFGSVITIGNDDADNCGVFGCAYTTVTTGYQQVFKASAFGVSGPIEISDFTIFGVDIGAIIDTATYQVYFSTDPHAFGKDSGTLVNNLGADNTLFATVTAGPTIPVSFTVTGTSPFLYDPSKGDLLMDFRFPGASNIVKAINGGFEADQTSGNELRSYTNTGFSTDTVNALVTRFDFTGPAAPEPSTFALAGGVLAFWALKRRKQLR